MPELPEVETIRQMLRKGDKETSGLIETEFSKVEVLWEKTVATPTIEKFYQDLPGQRIEEIGRRGKFLTFQSFYFHNADPPADERRPCY